MLDVFWRLHGDEEHFFVPYDLEMSNQELHYVCRKAEQWRGEEGERRKVAVYDYIWEEEDVSCIMYCKSLNKIKAGPSFYPPPRSGKGDIGNGSVRPSVRNLETDFLRKYLS